MGTDSVFAQLNFTFPKPHCRFDFRLQLHNMKENINMNTLSATEKQVMNIEKKVLLLSSQGIWVPKLVFVNTEKKLNTKNDDKAFAVARWDFIQESGRFLSPGEILRTQKAAILCWITSTFLR